MSIKVLYDFVPKDFEINDHLFYWKKSTQIDHKTNPARWLDLQKQNHLDEA